jgi:hypothetical protein
MICKQSASDAGLVCKKCRRFPEARAWFTGAVARLPRGRLRGCQGERHRDGQEASDHTAEGRLLLHRRQRGARFWIILTPLPKRPAIVLNLRTHEADRCRSAARSRSLADANRRRRPLRLSP